MVIRLQALSDSFGNAAETLERDTFKSASEAQQFGLIDEVIEKRPVDQPVAK